MSQEARWSQDRNVGFVGIWIKEFIKKLSAQGKETEGLLLGEDEKIWEMGTETDGRRRDRGTQGK